MADREKILQAVQRKNIDLGNNGVGTADDQQRTDRLIASNPNFVKSELVRANEVMRNRQSQGLDTSLQQNYIQKLLGSSTSPSNGFNAEESMNALSTFAEQGRDASIRSQQAILDQNRANQLNEIKKAYEDAVAEGKISIREAEKQFANNKAEIEKEAYLDSERSLLYGQSMGIQNSEQMVGIQVGDNARKNDLISANLSDRDSRINILKDRINALTAKKGFDVANINAQYNAGVLKANADADLAYNTNMFNLKKDDYTASRAEDFEMKKMDRTENFAVQQFEKENKAKLEQMFVGHELDLEKIAVQLQNDLKMEGVRDANQRARIAQSAANEMAAIQSKYQFELDANKRAYTDKNSDEYKIRVAKIEEDRNSALSKIYSEKVFTKQVDNIMDNPLLPASMGGTAPDYTYKDPLHSWNPFGAASNNKKAAGQAQVIKEREAILRRLGLVK